MGDVLRPRAARASYYRADALRRAHETLQRMNPCGEVAGFPLYPADAPFDVVQAALEAHELGDGLPLVVPTEGRVEQMLGAVREPQRVAGLLPPLMGELRPDAVAYQCVLAGCRPEELPVVWSALLACAEPRFNLLGILTTTGTPAVATVVHGEAAERLHLNSGSNCLGPGARANACIGRAISLCLLNVAGARPGIGDMSTMGQPGKYGFCFAETPHPFAPPLPSRSDPPLPSRSGLPLPSRSGLPLPSRSGLLAGGSAVTVLGVSGSAEVLPLSDERRPGDILDPLALSMAAAIAVSGGGNARSPAEQYLLLPPELADCLHRAGWSLAQVQAALYESRPIETSGAPADASWRVAEAANRIHLIVTGGPGVKMTYLPPWAGGTESVTIAVQSP